MKILNPIILASSIVIIAFFSLSGIVNDQQPPAQAQLAPPAFTTPDQQSDTITNQTQSQPQNITDMLSMPASINVSDVNFEAYENPEFGLSIEYPESWRVSENSLADYAQIVSFYSPLENLSDAIPVQVGISRVDYAQNITQNNYTALTLNTTQSFGINATESETILSQRPADQLVAFLPGDEVTPATGIMQVWSVKDNLVYIIAFTAEADKFSTYLPVVNNMVDSFQVDDWMESTGSDQ